MKRLIFLAIVIAVGMIGGVDLAPAPEQRGDAVVVAGGADETLAAAYDERRVHHQVQGGGHVTRILADDHEGRRHQRFIVRLASGQTLLVAHNVDLAARVAPLDVGDYVEFHGEYEWNPQGGVIHWTHHDPRGRHVAGWIKHEGRTYQ